MIKLTPKNSKEVIKLLRQEKIVGLPTDTIYGFSCLSTSDEAIKNLCKLKQCSDENLFIVLVSERYNLETIAELDEISKDFIKKNTPNPVTMILKKRTDTNLAKNFTIPTIAVRIPKDKFLQALLDEVGVLVSTSCNIHGSANLTECEEIIKTFPTLDAIVMAENSSSRTSSTIVDLTTGEFKILRQGDYIVH